MAIESEREREKSASERLRNILLSSRFQRSTSPSKAPVSARARSGSTVYLPLAELSPIFSNLFPTMPAILE